MVRVGVHVPFKTQDYLNFEHMGVLYIIIMIFFDKLNSRETHII